MTELRDYVCWTVENVVTTIQTEAVTASSAVFKATHTPLKVQRAQIVGRAFRNTGAQVSEKDVLEDFLGRRTTTGTLVLPIVGESGSGKSHLVRWVKENLPDSDKRVVIYLEKTRTSLRHVIESLLEGIEDEEIDLIRADVRSATSGTDVPTLARRLTSELMLALAGTTSSGLRGQQRQLAGPKGLALILQDPVLQEQMLKPTGFIPSFAKHMLSDVGTHDERPPHFSVSDLPLSVASSMEGVAAPTRAILRLLLSRAEMREAAVELLNEHWEKSVQATSALGGGRILDAMKKVRQVYARQGKEIILLIEDFALIQGVQRDLLDAITETSQREGATVLAPMRTLMAINSGYFHDLAETASTRIEASTSGHVYNVDLVLDADSDDAVTGFAGRYLNAARRGRKELEAHPAQLVNHCDACPVKGPCHNTFGTSAEGFGLYPFNRSALLRTVHAVALPEEPHSFVPRRVLSRALIPVLTDGVEAIQTGTFPDEEFRSRFKTNREAGDRVLSGRVRAGIEELDPLDAPRRQALLEFWADSPEELVNLDPAIATAFSVPALAIDPVRSPTASSAQSTPPNISTPSRTSPGSGQASPGISAALQARLDAVEDWGTSQAGLTTSEASTVRGLLSRAAVYRMTSSHPPTKPCGAQEAAAAGWTNKANTVSIEGAAAEALARGNSPITFKRGPINAEFFKSLLLLAENSPVPPRSSDVVRLSTLADQYARLVRDRIVAHSQVTDAHLVVALRVSLLGAALAGHAHPMMSLPDLHAAAFEPGHSWQRPDMSSRTPMWQQCLDAHLAKREMLVDTLRSALGVGQGAGAVQVIDAARALPLLRQAQQSWDLTGAEIPKWAQDAAAPLMGMPVVVRTQHAHLAALVREMREFLPRGEGPAEVLSQISVSLEVAARLGLEGGNRAPQIRGLLDVTREADWKTLPSLERDLAKLTPDLEGAAAMAATLQGVVPLRDPHLTSMHALLQQADGFLNDALQAAAERGESSASTASQQMQDLLEAWQELAHKVAEGNA